MMEIIHQDGLDGNRRDRLDLQFLDGMSCDECEVLFLRFYSEFSIAQIMRLTHLSRIAVKESIGKAVRRLVRNCFDAVPTTDISSECHTADSGPPVGAGSEADVNKALNDTGRAPGRDGAGIFRSVLLPIHGTAA